MPEFRAILGDCLEVLPVLTQRFTLIHSDIPFNTGKIQKGQASQYLDRFDSDYLPARFDLFRQVMAPNSLVAIQCDEREFHAAHRALRRVFGKKQDRGTLIWSYETGGVSRRWWSMKHQYIMLFGVGEPKFYLDRVPTESRKSPTPGYTEPKRISSVWPINWSTTDPTRTGYPNQKPIEIARRLILAHTDVGDWVLDPFCGSGTTGEAAMRALRNVVLIDRNPDAVAIAGQRLSGLLTNGKQSGCKR